jgi:hypothetical protein
MHSIYGTPIIRALTHRGHLVRLIRNGMASFRPATLDAAVITIAVAVIYAFSDFYDLPPKLFQLGTDYAEWDLDDAIFVIFS